MKNTLTLAAFGLALAVNYAWHWHSNSKLDAAPYSEWFQVRSVNVASSPEGSDPVLIYDREIRKEFEGEWIVEIVRTSDKFTICSNSGKNQYEPQDKLPDAGVTLSWFIRKDCNLPKGEYVAKSFWTIKPKGYPEKSLRVISNIFEVH